jgi:hypothetical protein
VSELELEPIDDGEEAPPRLILPRPLAHQLDVHESPARFKLERWGRRTGKTRHALICALSGHGPGWRTGTPLHPGILQGWDVPWIARDYKQASMIWEEELKPRFMPYGQVLPGCSVNEAALEIVIADCGRLQIRTAENAASIRGLGARLKGVIIDEAAWLKLRHIWLAIVRPILVDNIGWALITSTTNAGLDGDRDSETGNPTTPSWFNTLCAAVMAGKPGYTLEDGWLHSHKTARENPVIDQAELARALAGYHADSLELNQEWEAKLLTGGAGLAFPEFREDLHVQRIEPPADAVWLGGLDWGYDQPTWFGAVAFFGDQRRHVRSEYYGRKVPPYDTGWAIGERLAQLPTLGWIGCDSSIFNDTDGEQTIGERIQKGLLDRLGKTRCPKLIGVTKGPRSRQTRKALMHEVLKYEERPDPEDATRKTVPSWLAPKLTIHPDCADLVRTLPALPKDPRDPEDVDTDAEDHPYDGLGYLLLAQRPRVEKRREPESPLTRDHHPGMTKAGREKNVWGGPKPGPQGPYQSGIQWRFRRPTEGDT